MGDIDDTDAASVIATRYFLLYSGTLPPHDTEDKPGDMAVTQSIHDFAIRKPADMIGRLSRRLPDTRPLMRTRHHGSSATERAAPPDDRVAAKQEIYQD